MTNETIWAILKGIGDVINSLGGGAVLTVLLSGWLGKLWAERILAEERHELAKLQDEHRIAIEELSNSRADVLLRRRNVYAKLATSMRVFLAADLSPERKAEFQRQFIEAYDEAYLWASEDVAAAIRDFMIAQEKHSQLLRAAKVLPPNAPFLEAHQTALGKAESDARDLFDQCHLKMRQDCGFAESKVEHRRVSF